MTTSHPDHQDEPGARDALVSELRRRADERRAAGAASFDHLVVDIAGEDRSIATPEFQALREVVARQVDMLQPAPARSLLGRIRAKIERLIVRANGPVPVLIREEVNELSVALIQHLAAMSRELVSLRAQVTALTAERGVDREGTSDSATVQGQREAD